VLLQRLPWVLFGLAAGVAADRFDRRLISVGVQVARAGILAALAALVAVHRDPIGVVLGAMFLLGTTETFADTTATTLLPMVVEREDLPIGNARLMAGMVTVNQLAGPSLGAGLFAVSEVAAFVVPAVCALGAAALVARMALPPHGVAPEHRRRAGHEIVEGFRWLWHHAAVRTLAVTIVTFNVTYGAAWSILVLYARDQLHSPDIGFGLLTTAVAAGGLIGTGAYGWLTARVSLGNLMRAGLLIETATHFALAVTTALPVALGIMVVFGAHAFVWGTTSTSIRQRVVPTALQGRVGSVYLISVQGGLVAGSAVGGVVAGAWGVTGPFWFAGVGSAVLVVLLWHQLTLIAHGDEHLS
jgi:MFS family permease